MVNVDRAFAEIGRFMRPGEFLSALDLAKRMVDGGVCRPALLQILQKDLMSRLRKGYIEGRFERQRIGGRYRYGVARPLPGARRATWIDVLGRFDGRA